MARDYRDGLKVGTENNVDSISFPSISTGIHGYPVAEAAKVAMKTVIVFLRAEVTSLKEVIFILFDSRTHESYQCVLKELVNATDK